MTRWQGCAYAFTRMGRVKLLNHYFIWLFFPVLLYIILHYLPGMKTAWDKTAVAGLLLVGQVQVVGYQIYYP